MNQLINDGDHIILEGAVSTLIRCLLVEVIYETTAMLSSENCDTLNMHESFES